MLPAAPWPLVVRRRLPASVPVKLRLSGLSAAPMPPPEAISPIVPAVVRTPAPLMFLASMAIVPLPVLMSPAMVISPPASRKIFALLRVVMPRRAAPAAGAAAPTVKPSELV